MKEQYKTKEQLISEISDLQLKLTTAVEQLQREITERGRLEEALRDSQRRYEALLTALPIGLFHGNADGLCFFTNEQISKITGLSPDERAGLNWMQSLHPDDREQVMAEWTRCAERKQAEEALRTARQQLLDIFDFLPIVILNSCGEISYTSPSVERVLGYKPAELTGQNAFDIIHPDDRQKIINTFTESIKKPGLPQHLEFRFRHKDSSWRILEAVGKNLLANPAVEGVVANLRDITDHKKTEEKLSVAHKQFLDIIEFYPEATFVIDGDKKVIAWNRAIEEMTGIRKEDILGKSDNDCAKAIYGEMIPMLADIIVSGCGEKETNNEFRKVENIGKLLYAGGFVQTAFGGKGAYLFMVAAPLNDSGGNVIGAVESICDITNLKAAEAALHEANKKAEQAERMALIGTMAAGIAHEINQPLNSLKIIIDGMLFLSKMGRSFRFEEIVKRLEVVSAQADRIDKIIKRTRSFVRSERAVVNEPCDLNVVIVESLRMLDTQLTSAGITIETVLSAGLPPVRGNFHGLEEVVLNIFVNAMQALEKVSKTEKVIHISTYLSEEGNAVVEISDNATGVPDELKEKIFEPFFTTKEFEKGMGLGLSIVRSIVTSYNGQMSVKSNERGGSTFQIEFPALR